MDLAGKSILFVGIGFYDYELAIVEELRRRGAFVLYHRDLPAFALHGPLAPLLRRFRINISGAIRAHHARILASTLGRRIDYVFVINGEHLDAAFLTAVRDRHPNVECIAYLWDSLTRFPQLLECQAHYDHVYTSDRGDSLAVPAIHFRPLFFRVHASMDAPQPAEWYDLSFIGWLHHDRVNRINALARFAEQHDLRAFFYLYTGLATYLRLRLTGGSRFVRTRLMSYAQNARVTDASRVIVDLPHPMQTGMTMRAIEAVGAGKKMITTARDVVNYDFYNPANILLVDGDTMEIDPAFLEVAPVPVDPKIVARYTLAAWVTEVFAIDRPAAAPSPEPDSPGPARTAGLASA
jgi:hypothetical protein